MSYLIPVNVARFEQTIKKSRFIAVTGPASSKEQVNRFIADVAEEFPDARHTCHASITGSPTDGVQHSNDDGEPSGTAGKPILNVLQHSGAGDIISVVVRYFGGIKLGSGGLIRAYSSSAASTIKTLQTRLTESKVQLYLEVDFSYESQIRHQLELSHASDIQAFYTNRLRLSCEMPIQHIAALTTTLNNLTRGAVKIELPPNYLS